MATADLARRVGVRRIPPVSDLLRWAFGVLILVAVGGFLLREAVGDVGFFVEITLIGITNGSIYALVALGYTLVYGIIELINFAHGDNFMLGTFETKSIVSEGQFQIPLIFGVIGIPLGTQIAAEASGFDRAYAIGMALVFSMLFCMVVNVSIERLGYKPLRHQPRLAALITAIGFSFILQNIGLSWKGPGRVPIPDLLPRGNLLSVGGVDYQIRNFLVIAITIPLLVVLTWLVRATKQGKAMRATAQDRDASAMMGINVDRTISFTFALAGALAGAGGAIYALNIGNTYFSAGFRLGLFAFTAAVLGGIGNLTGAVLGGFLIGMIQAYNEGLAEDPWGARWTTTFIFSILILILVFRPSGLLGEQTPEGQ